jgi:hypothetical protein
MNTIIEKKIIRFLICYFSIIFYTKVSAQGLLNTSEILKPVIDGDWWKIASTPDLGEYNSSDQQPVDFGIWQACDSTWQLWSCIRNSNFPGSAYTTRFLYGWEGKSLTSTDWKPKGIKWAANPLLGENQGGMQAPFVLKEDNTYYLFYGDWKRICLAKSNDGKNFTRVVGGNGQPGLITEHSQADFQTNTARDPMVLKRGNTFYCYYTSHIEDPVNDGAAFCRTSLNLQDWTESVLVSHTPPYKDNSEMYSDECPHVVFLPENGFYYLFVTQMYGQNSQTTVYASSNPMYFGVDDKSRLVCTLPIAAPEIVYKDGQYFIAALNNTLDRVRIVKLKWKK